MLLPAYWIVIIREQAEELTNPCVTVQGAGQILLTMEVADEELLGSSLYSCCAYSFFELLTALCEHRFLVLGVVGYSKGIRGNWEAFGPAAVRCASSY